MAWAYYAGAFVTACRRNGAHFSVTVRMDPKVRHAVAGIAEDAWTMIKYLKRHLRRSDRHMDLRRRDRRSALHRVASTTAHRTHANLIVRRVKRLNPKAAAHGQGEFVLPRTGITRCSPTARSPSARAESDRRDHAVIEQVFADLIDRP